MSEQRKQRQAARHLHELATNLRAFVADGKVETCYPGHFSQQTKKQVPPHMKTRGMTPEQGRAIIAEANRLEEAASVILEGIETTIHTAWKPSKSPN